MITTGLFDLPYLWQASLSTDWASRVVANGGARPSSSTITAMETFRLGLVANGLDTRIYSLCVFVPDGIIAATTPLIKNMGFDPWTNTSFVSGDLTVDGLKGDGSTKSLNSGVQAKSGQAINAVTGNVGLTVVVSATSTNTVEVDVGAQDSASTTVPALALLVSGYSPTTGGFGRTGFTSRDSASADVLFTPDWTRTGYVSGNSVGGTSSLYTANPEESHHLLTSGSFVTTATTTSNTIYAFALNLAGVASNRSAKRLSLVAIHDGFSSSDSATFYSLIDTLRTSLAGGRGDPVDDWVFRVVAAGGVAPSGGTVSALKTFYAGLVSNSLLAKMSVVNVIAPDNLTAAQVPLIWRAGNSIWTNTAFVSGDLTTSGLQGNGSTKWLKTGVIPSGAYTLTNTSAGLSLMISVVPASSSMVEFGGQSGASDNCSLYNFTGSAYSDLWGTSGGNRATAALPTTNWPGFLVSSRTAANASAIYRASKANSFALLVNNTTAQSVTGPSNVELWLFTLNNSGSSFDPSNRTISFAAVHAGLSSTDASNLYSLVAALRTSLGGGDP